MSIMLDMVLEYKLQPKIALENKGKGLFQEVS